MYYVMETAYRKPYDVLYSESVLRTAAVKPLFLVRSGGIETADTAVLGIRDILVRIPTSD